MSGIWQEPTATEPVPFQIMRQKEARATKTETGISQSGSIPFRIRGDVPGATNTEELLRRWTLSVIPPCKQ